MTDYQPVIIIGAPRSGTNMLRDVLLGIDKVCSWPCDEINYIWRHGNVRYPSDEFPASLATPAVSAYIRRAFDKAALNFDGDVVLEKTCHNAGPHEIYCQGNAPARDLPRAQSAASFVPGPHLSQAQGWRVA